jgi:hypothetical protein
LDIDYAGVLSAFEEGTSMQELVRLLDGTAHWPLEKAAALAKLALRCVKMEPKERPALAEVMSALRALLRD